MKRLFYRIYALLFNMSAALFPVKNKRAAFVSMHNENFKDSLGAVMEEFRRRGFECVEITRRDLDIAIRNVPRVFSFFFQKSRLLPGELLLSPVHNAQQDSLQGEFLHPDILFWQKVLHQDTLF